MKALLNRISINIKFYIDTCFDPFSINKKIYLCRNFIKHIMLVFQSKKNFLNIQNQLSKRFFKILNLIFPVNPDRYLITSNIVYK